MRVWSGERDGTDKEGQRSLDRGHGKALTKSPQISFWEGSAVASASILITIALVMLSSLGTLLSSWSGALLYGAVVVNGFLLNSILVISSARLVSFGGCKVQRNATQQDKTSQHALAHILSPASLAIPPLQHSEEINVTQYDESQAEIMRKRKRRGSAVQLDRANSSACGRANSSSAPLIAPPHTGLGAAEMDSTVVEGLVKAVQEARAEASEAKAHAAKIEKKLDELTAMMTAMGAN